MLVVKTKRKFKLFTRNYVQLMLFSEFCFFFQDDMSEDKNEIFSVCPQA